MSNNDQWRAISAGEIAAEPDARFGGAIALMFFAATVALLPIAILVVGLARDAQGTSWFLSAMLRQAFAGSDIKSITVAASILQTTAVMIWAAMFIVSTLVRTSWGLVSAALLFAIAALIGPAWQCVMALLVIGGTGGWFAAGTQLPQLALSAVAALAFWIYVQEGRRPNLYFRRRVRTASARPA